MSYLAEAHRDAAQNAQPQQMQQQHQQAQQQTAPKDAVSDGYASFTNHVIHAFPRVG